MKSVILGTLLAGTVAQLTGCIIDNSNNNNTAHITANWSIKTVAGAAVTCPPGFDTAAIVSQEIDAAGNAIGSPITDLFNCSANHGVTAGLPAGVFQTWVEITDTTGANVYARSLSAIVDLTAADKTFTAEIYNDGGFFQMAWALHGATSGGPLTCAAAGADTVEIISTVSGGTQFLTDKFTCADGSGVTSALAAGSYTLSVDATLGNGGALGAPVNFASKVIQAPNKVTDLGSVMIPIDGK
jgi:hypothetical protein